MTGQRDKGIGAHIHGEMKSLAARLNVGIGQIFFIRKGNGVDEDIKRAPFLF